MRATPQLIRRPPTPTVGESVDGASEPQARTVILGYIGHRPIPRRVPPHGPRPRGFSDGRSDRAGSYRERRGARSAEAGQGSFLEAGERTGLRASGMHNRPVDVQPRDPLLDAHDALTGQPAQ